MAAGALDTVKQVSDVASSVATIVALVVGGIWAYWAFVRERTRWPKARLELVLTHRRLTEETTLLHVKAKIHNAGRGLMTLTRIRMDVYRVRPLTGAAERKLAGGCLKAKGETAADWPFLEQGEFLWGGDSGRTPPEIEPGENDEFGSDFLLPSDLESVHVYVYVENAARKRVRRIGRWNDGKQRKPLGWCVTAYYDLMGPAGTGAASNAISSEPVKEVA